MIGKIEHLGALLGSVNEPNSRKGCFKDWILIDGVIIFANLDVGLV